ncbi:MAG: hypothetical protein IJX37_09380 [Oscillospiraceae bacterium]|nr:hypothetical protein [Oscillospiraceae bacterium]
MTNKKSTKRALLMSALSLLLCVSMLVGTTFAWFTDEVKSGTNIIAAGNLDVELTHTNKAVTDKDVKGETELFKDVKLWEPGAVAYEKLTVKNVGDLALKYNLAINVAAMNGVEVEGKYYTLADALKVAVVAPEALTSRETAIAAGNEAGWTKLMSWAETGNLYPEEGKDTETYGVVIYWEPTDNDNIWNLNNGKTTTDGGKQLTIDLGVHLTATQLTYEHDSYGNDYDAEAGGLYSVLYTFDNAEDLNAFNPDNYANNENVDGAGMSVKDGVAVVGAKGAFYFEKVNLNKYDYTIEYDVNTSAMTEGDTINFETGDTDSWAGTNHITIEKGSSIVSIGPAANNPTGYVDNVEMGEQLHIVHTYSFNAEGKLVTTTTISDGELTVTASKTVDSAATKLYWDVYELSENAGGKVTLDNFAVSAEKTKLNTAAKLEEALAAGGTVVLTTDIAAAEPIEIPEGVAVVLDTNGYSVSNTAGYSVINNGDLTIVGNGEVNGLGGIRSNGGKLTIEGGTYSAASNWSTGTYQHVLKAENTEVVINGGTFDATIGGTNNAMINVAAGSTVTINGGTFKNVEGALTAFDPYLFNYEKDGKLIINDGTFYGGWRFNGETATTDIYGGNFTVSYDGQSFHASSTHILTVYGGTFAPSKLADKAMTLVAEGYKATQVGDVWMVTAENTNVVSGADGLVEALESGKDVILTDDVKIDPAGMSNAYGTTGINVKNGQTVDGGGNVLDIQGAGGTWDSGINTTGGTIKNITVTGSFRGIFINHNSDYQAQVILENVIIDGTVYTISCDQGSNNGLKATNCTFNGWTSYAATLGKAEFVDCSFGEGSGYQFMRPYAESTFTNCVFEEGFEFDTSKTSDITFINCYYGDTLITAENAAALADGETVFFYNGLNGITIQ